jgi:predicted AlkP superfamily phosphohydrolase/phosphomutase
VTRGLNDQTAASAHAQPQSVPDQAPHAVAGAGPHDHPVLVIGLDGGTFAALGPLIEAGLLPNLSEMVGTGAWGVLSSTLPPHSAPAWASFATGANPGRHGVYHFRAIDQQFYEGSNYARIVNARSIALPTLWRWVSQAGRRVGVMNVPLTYPPEPVNGFLVSGMLTPPSAPVFTSPAELSTSLEGYTIDLDSGASGELAELSNLHSADGLQLLANQLDRQLESRTRTALRLLSDYRPDLAVVVFTETDRLQHFFWPCLDPDGDLPAHLQPLVAWVKAFHRRLDDAIGQLRAAMGDRTVCIVMSDHGFGPSPTRQFFVNSWLRDQGMLAVKARSFRSIPARLLAWARLDQAVLHRALSAILPKHRVLRLRAAWGQTTRQPIDWDHTSAYFMPLFDFVGGIRIRASAGTDEYERIRSRLIADLEGLVDANTGKRVVASVGRREDIYDGPYADRAPDVIFVLDSMYVGDRSLLAGSHIGTMASAGRQWLGTHRPDGIVLMAGPPVAAGQRRSPMHIWDLAPTILYLMGVPIPEHMDGRVLVEMLSPEYVAAQPARTVAAGPDSSAEAARLPPPVLTDEAAVVQRLRSLGYLD